MTLKSMALGAYPIHTVLLNVSVRMRELLTYNGQTLVGFPLMICTWKPLEEEEGTENEQILEYEFLSLMSSPLKCGTTVKADSEGTERWMRKLHEAIKVVVGPL